MIPPQVNMEGSRSLSNLEEQEQMGSSTSGNGQFSLSAYCFFLMQFLISGKCISIRASLYGASFYRGCEGDAIIEFGSCNFFVGLIQEQEFYFYCYREKELNLSGSSSSSSFVNSFFPINSRHSSSVEGIGTNNVTRERQVYVFNRVNPQKYF